MSETMVINVEAGLPTVEQARRRMLDALNATDASRTKIAVIIHGYGSTGAGGKLGTEMRKTLARLRNQGKCKYVIWGEQFSMFDETTRKAVEYCPALARSPYYAKDNFGVTIVVF
jgi:hypothetical protein